MAVSVLSTLKGKYRKMKVAIAQSRYKNQLTRAGEIICEDKVSINTKCVFEGQNKIFTKTELNNCYIGRGSYVSHDSFLSGVKIGRFCSIGPFVKTVNGRHPTKDFVSTHPAFFSTAKQNGTTYVDHSKYAEHQFVEDHYGIVVGNDVWIGGNVTLLEGIRIGNGAIIAAGAVVNKDVEPYTIVGGVPAKVIKKRFDDQEIEKLQNVKWWNWENAKIATMADAFCTFEEFCRKEEAQDSENRKD